MHIDLYQQTTPGDVAEFQDLVRAAGCNVLSLVTGKRTKPQSKYFVGEGKALEIQQAVQTFKADVVIFNHELSPAQERNLEKLVQCRVVDRVGLILDIFAQRARTFEGKLQVELAQLQHLSTRLVGGWRHLERQRGGIGLRGPGETQLETDRRLVGLRIKSIKKRLEKVVKQRDQGRRARKRADIPTVSLVGYTNAGKSTLFNRLTEASVFTANQLFATLDPTLRYVELPTLGKTIFADTVGFIHDLPHDLIAAFRATLEEACQANLLLHVIDVSSPYVDTMINDVESVLTEIEADSVPVLPIYNKIDRQVDMPARIDRDHMGKPTRVFVSALTGEGIDLIQQAITELLTDLLVTYHIILKPHQGALHVILKQMQVIESLEVDESGNLHLVLRMQRKDFERIVRNAL